MAPPSPLDDPAISAHAWGRFRRQMRLTAGLTLIAEAAALSWLYASYGMVSIHLYIGVGLAIALSLFLVSGLMGLVFLSSGTGHDQAVTGRRSVGERR